MKQPYTRVGEKRLGAVLGVIGAAMTVFTWYDVARTGGYFEITAVMGPGLVVLGIALLLHPGVNLARVARGEEWIPRPGLRDLGPFWWGVAAVGAFVGLAHLIAVETGRVPDF